MMRQIHFLAQGCDFMLNEATQLINERKYEEAQKFLRKLIEAHPNHPEVNFYYATTQDALGMEREAIPYYHKALNHGIKGELRQQTYFQLGSSYRCIGEYQKAADILEEGLMNFSDNLALKTLLAMVRYHTDDEKEAVSMLLEVIVYSSSDPWIQKYRRALSYYADRLDEKW